MLVNLIVADRIAPRYRGTGPEDEIIERYRGYVAPYAGRVRVLRGALLLAHHGHGRLRAVAELDPVLELDLVRHQGSAVPQGHLVLRLPPAVPAVRGRLDLRRAARHPHRVGRLPLPERRHPAAEPVPAGHAAGEGAPVGAARADGADEDVSVLPGAVRAHEVEDRFRRRRHVHRRARASSRAAPAHRHLDRRGRAVHRQHLAARLGVPDHRGRTVGLHLDRGRHDLSRGHPEVPGAAERALQGDAVHQAQHRGDARRVRALEDLDQDVQLQPRAQQSRDRDVQAHSRQLTSLRPAARAGGVQGHAGDHALLPIPRRRRRSLQDR